MAVGKSQKTPQNSVTLGACAAEDHPPLERLAHCEGACHIDCWIYSILPSLRLPFSFRRLPRMDGIQYTYDNTNGPEEISETSPAHLKVASDWHDSHVHHAFYRSHTRYFKRMARCRHQSAVVLRQPAEICMESRIYGNLSTRRYLFAV